MIPLDFTTLIEKATNSTTDLHVRIYDGQSSKLHVGLIQTAVYLFHIEDLGIQVYTLDTPPSLCHSIYSWPLDTEGNSSLQNNQDLDILHKTLS
jgi:hypothetical protein